MAQPYLALLRGINVGGNNIIKMADLKVCFEDMGLSPVQTYIQSGNVMFEAKRATAAQLETTIEKRLSKTFGYESRVVVLPHTALTQVVDQAPKGFGTKPDKYRYDVIFFKKPLTPSKALNVFETRDEVDTVHTGKHAIYFSRLTSRATQSKMGKIIGKPEYKYMTIRNWNTTNKLLSIMETWD